MDSHGRKCRNGSFQASGPGVSLVRNTAISGKWIVMEIVRGQFPMNANDLPTGSNNKLVVVHRFSRPDA